MTPVTYLGVEIVVQEDPQAHPGIYAWSLLAEDEGRGDTSGNGGGGAGNGKGLAPKESDSNKTPGFIHSS